MDHREISMDPNEQTALRYRLYSRVLRHVGLSQIAVLQPYLQTKIDSVLAARIESQQAVKGTRISLSATVPLANIALGKVRLKLAPLMRELVTGSLTTYFFGKRMCRFNLRRQC